MICAACNHNVPEVFPLRSVLDFRTRFICGRCFDHQAEPADIIVAMGAGICLLPLDVAQAVHVYHDNAYLTLGAWQDRPAAPDLEPMVEPEPEPIVETCDDEEEAEAVRLVHDMKAVTNSMRRRFGTWPAAWAS